MPIRERTSREVTLSDHLIQILNLFMDFKQLQLRPEQDRGQNDGRNSAQAQFEGIIPARLQRKTGKPQNGRPSESFPEHCDFKANALPTWLRPFNGLYNWLTKFSSRFTQQYTTLWQPEADNNVSSIETLIFKNFSILN